MFLLPDFDGPGYRVLDFEQLVVQEAMSILMTRMKESLSLPSSSLTSKFLVKLKN